MGRGRTGAKKRAGSSLAAICLLASPLALGAEQVVVTWQGGAGNWSAPANWSPAIVPDNGEDTYLIRIDDDPNTDSFASLDISATVDGIEIDAGDTLQVENHQVLTIMTDSIVNNGTLILHQNTSGGSTRLQFTGPVTLQGSGEYVMPDFFSVNRFGPLGGLTTLNPEGTIRGSGSIQLGAHRFVNQGLLRHEGSWWMTIQIGAGGFENSGILEAAGSAGLTLQGSVFNSVFDNSAGIMRVLEGSHIRLSSITIRGGELNMFGMDEYRLSGSSIFEDLTLKGTFAQRSHENVGIRGTITNQGTWTLSDIEEFGFAQIRPENGAALAGDGVLVMQDVFLARIECFSGGLFTHEEDHTIRGTGQILVRGGSMVNKGLIRQTKEGYWSTMTINAGRGTLTNESVIESDPTPNPGLLELTDGTFVNTESGVIRAVGTGVVQLGPSAMFTGGIWETEGSGVFRFNSTTVSTGSRVPILKDLVINGNIDQPDLASAIIRGRVINNGQWTANRLSESGFSDIVAQEGAVLAGTGNILMSGNTRIRFITDGTVAIHEVNHTIRGGGRILDGTGGMINRGTVRQEGSTPLTIAANALGFVNVGQLAVTGTGGLILSNGANFTNAGETLVETGRNLTVTTGNYVQTGGETQVNGTMTLSQVGASAQINGGILSGTGIITRNVINSGFVAPGTSAGLLTINQLYTQSASGALVTELGGLLPGVEHDQLAVVGAATIDGRLHVELINDFVPTVGNEFTVLTAASVTGEFDVVSGAMAADGLKLEPVYLPTEVRLVAFGLDGIAVNDVAVEEGISGTTDAVFTITLSEANETQTVEVTVQTEDGTATAGSDYVALPPTVVSFAPGETSKNVTVKVINDGQAEPEEYFKLVLTDSVNAPIARASGVGIIAESPQLDVRDVFILY